MTAVPASQPVLPSLDTAPLALVVDLVRSGRAATRRELTTLTGLSRKVVAQRVVQVRERDALDLLGCHGPTVPTGGPRGNRAQTV